MVEEGTQEVNLTAGNRLAGGASGPSRRAAAGFWHADGAAQLGEDVRKGTTDPRWSPSFAWQRGLPRQSDIAYHITCQAELYVGQKQEPGPPVSSAG